MARPPTPLVKGWADKSDTTRLWNDFTRQRRRRLHALEMLWDWREEATRTWIAQIVGVSRRQLSRWIQAFNEGGLDGLMFPQRDRPGRKHKINSADFQEKVIPLAKQLAVGKVRLNVAELQRELASQHQIKISAGTLTSYLRRIEFIHERPRTPKINRSWSKPWPQEYGNSLEEFLQRQTRAGSVDPGS